eukprot:Rhum_TRINITY_DN25809_c0_g2::Rhum_TRINITY_DN25809_c0_g2_i1::g.182826::m.182826
MGNCCSGSSTGSSQGGTTSRGSRYGVDEACLLENGKMPAAKAWVMTDADRLGPVTAENLKAKREMFWDTQPHYGGKKEIWAALQSVLPLVAENEQLGIAVLQAAEIRFPRGNWTEVYDTTGFRYEIPLYVVTDPSNLES